MHRSKISKKIGLPPGSLVYIGDKEGQKVTFHIIDFSADHCDEKEVHSIEECRPYRDSRSLTWININGIHDLEVIEALGRIFGLHPLLLEDVVNTGHRPKFDDYDTYAFVVLKMLDWDPHTQLVQSEQISLIFGRGFVISLQEVEGDLFDPVRMRIRKGKNRIRQGGSDYLAYALIDTVVDHYFKILETFSDRIEQLQDEVIDDATSETLKVIQSLKHQMQVIRRTIWPLREIVNAMVREESALIRPDVILYLRDVYDHTVQIIDTVETHRDLLAGLLDVYLSGLSIRMNEVMKVLTIIATIFIPLSFLAGVYGMNFKYMPELDWPWAYPALWGVMGGVFCAMLAWFKHKKWF